MKKKFVLAAAVLAFVLFIGASYFSYGLLSEGASAGVSTAKKPAADFTVRDSGGNSVRLSDLRGKPTVVNFWATWCPPCRSEMPHFQAVYEEMKGEVNFMMIDLVGGGETQDKAEDYLRQRNFSFPVYYDTTGEASGTYGVNAIPTSLFIDASGNITGQTVGAMDLATLKSGINSAR
ncbi:MAG: TlpA family protein disulfide reductase [Synergistaceae bacterium]|jgi:thiol-disulfide isomerase/thioredoxin|nr:TlpA family protein disulfide reductase [Synergistaceae bacterium]